MGESTLAAAAPAATGHRGSVPVGPLAVFDGTFDDTVALCVSAIAERRGERVATANLDFLALARRDAVLRADLERSSLVVADGAPIVWLARLAGARAVGRVPGVDLVQALFAASERLGRLRVAVYGSTPEVLSGALARVAESFPAVEVVCAISPPFRALSAEEEAGHRRALAAAEPDVVFVALGCPKQERLIASWYEAVPTAVWIGVGGTFDFLSGRRVRAPRLLQAAGLEWVVRLVQEPGRLWRRYLLRDVPSLVATVPGCLAARRRRR